MCSLVMDHLEPLLSTIISLYYCTLFEKAAFPLGLTLHALPFSMCVCLCIYSNSFILLTIINTQQNVPKVKCFFLRIIYSAVGISMTVHRVLEMLRSKNRAFRRHAPP